jgi:hypothetical protein
MRVTSSWTTREQAMIAKNVSHPIACFRGVVERLVAIGAMGLFCAAAYAGPYTVYGSQFAWVNNFSNSTINGNFSTNSMPAMTVWYDFSSYSRLEINRGDGWAHVTANSSAK